MLRFLFVFLFVIISCSVHANKDPAEMVLNTFCGDLELLYPKSDACYVCTQKLANMVYLLYRKQGWMTIGGNEAGQPGSSRMLLKRPSSSSQKLEDDEIKRNSIDALHGLTLG